MSNNNSVFCPAPFVHFYHKGSRAGKICCMAKTKVFHKDKASDTWTQAKYQQVRQDILDGKPLQECTACYDTEAQGGRSDRQYYLNKYKNTELTYDTLEGNIEFKKPIDLDLRLSNLCNLGCRMCGPHYSSVLEKSTPELKDLDGFDNQQIPNSMLSDEDIDWLITDNPNIRRIKFLGGEPTVMDEMYKILDILVEKKRQPYIGITTNCTNVNKRFINYLNYFKNITINMSIDGTSNTLEYIRYPVKYDTVKKNIITLSKLDITDLNVNYCIQALNVNNLKNSINFFASIEKLNDVNSVIVDYPIGASVYHLPVAYRKPYIEEALDSENISHPAFKKLFKAQLESIYKSDKEFEMIKFLHRNMRFDKLRNQHVYNVLPGLRFFAEEAIFKISDSNVFKTELIKHYIDKE